MIWPELRATLGLPAARQATKTPLRVSARTASQSASVWSTAGVRVMMPALLTRRSRWPGQAMDSSMRRWTAARSERSAAMAWKREVGTRAESAGMSGGSFAASRPGT